MQSNTLVKKDKDNYVLIEKIKLNLVKEYLIYVVN